MQDGALGCPLIGARIGRQGVKEIVELPLSEEELEALRTAAEAVRAKQADVDKLAG